MVYIFCNGVLVEPIFYGYGVSVNIVLIELKKEDKIYDGTW